MTIIAKHNMDSPSIVKKGRGFNLLHNGYRYSKDKRNDAGVQYWKCTNRDCSGRAHTSDTNGLQLLKSTEHDHEPEMEATISAKIKADLCKRAAANPTQPMKEVYNEYMNSADAPTVDDDILEPQLRSCTSQMYRARRQNMPPLPVTRDDIVLEGQWAVTNDNEPFILHQDNDMVLLGTDSNLHLLSTADTIFMDGTFKISPRQFVQLFTLHIIHMGFFVPLVYGLLKDKSAETYYHMFAHIRRKMAELNLILNPVSLMLDFESGIQPCLRQHFPTATIKGCNFHFTQAVWRKVQSLGLVTHYESGIPRRIIKSLMALPFIPRIWVRQAFATITIMNNGSLPAIAELLQYFSDTWLNGQYPVVMWNVYQQDIRTNNKVEGWHNSLNKSVKKCHPNIYELLNVLKTEQSTTERSVRSARLGAQPPPMRPKARERQQKISTLERELDTGLRSIDDYLAAMRRHVGYKKH